MTSYKTHNDMFESYNNIQTSYGPVMNGQNMQDSYQVKAQSEAMTKAQYEKPFRTTHASRVGY